MFIHNLSGAQIEQIRAKAELKARQVAKAACVDWDSLRWNDKEARIITQANKMHKK